MKETFKDYGITDIHPNGPDEQRTTCPACSHNRKKLNDRCLAVNVSKGTWFCHHCSWAGGLKADKDVKYIKSIKNDSLTLKEDHYGWFFENRSITKEVLDRNKVGWKKDVYFHNANGKKNAIAFNYFYGRKLVNVKYRSIDKDFLQKTTEFKCFYKINDVITADECIICEGEIDALSFEVAGYPNTVSVPNGAPDLKAKDLSKYFEYLDNTFEFFRGMKRIYLATDKDYNGKKLETELSRRLGRARCYVIDFPDNLKDANEVLVKRGRAALAQCVREAKPYPVEGVFTANQFMDEVLDIHKNGFPSGAHTGWYHFDLKLKFFESTLYTVTGRAGDGKSTFMDNLMIELTRNSKWRWGVFSPENGKVSIHLRRLVEILIGKPFLPGYNGQMSREEVEQAMTYINENIFFALPENGDYTLDNILDSAAYLVLKYGINAFVIDPWNNITHIRDRNESETDYTLRVLNRVLYFLREYSLAFFIVAHPAKRSELSKVNGDEIRDLYDVSGSQHWANKTEVGLSVNSIRNKQTRERRYTRIQILKVKHNYMGSEGYVKFNFDKSCQRFYEFDTHSKAGFSKIRDDQDRSYPKEWDEVPAEENEIEADVYPF